MPDEKIPIAVRPERTGWRDLGLSERHRQWGFNCPAVDLDFVLCEYDQGEPYAIVEYKRDTAAPTPLSHPTVRALERLATRAKVPFFFVVYTKDYAVYRVLPVNYFAQQKLQKTTTFSEPEYIEFLYRVRGRTVSAALF